MSQRKEVTGRDAYIMVEALTFAVEALSKLPIELRPDSNIGDMKSADPAEACDATCTHRAAGQVLISAGLCRSAAFVRKVREY